MFAWVINIAIILILLFIWWRFLHVIKEMTDNESMLNDDQFFADTVDTPREGIEQHKKGEYLKSTISKGKVLGRKKQWTHERIDKASGETTNKTYGEYKQRELNEKGEKTGKTLDKHSIKLYSTGISQVVRIRDVKNDRIIKDQMANIGCVLVCTFSNFLAAVLVAAHTANNLDLGHEQGLENERYESD